MLWDFGESIEWKQGPFRQNVGLLLVLNRWPEFCVTKKFWNLKKSNRYSRIIKNRRFQKQSVQIIKAKLICYSKVSPWQMIVFISWISSIIYYSLARRAFSESRLQRWLTCANLKMRKSGEKDLTCIYSTGVQCNRSCSLGMRVCQGRVSIWWRSQPIRSL